MDDDRYRGFIEEAFIRPMRSVLIVDDDYPTLEDMFTGKGKDDGKSWHGDPKAVKNVIDGFHNNQPPLIVDVHDGQNVETTEDAAAVEHLHQCDLLVLDFELNKQDEHDGAQAIGILRKILGNEQFNLVILHTRTDLDIVFPKVLAGVLRPAPSFIAPEEAEWAQGKMFEQDVEEPGYSASAMETIGAEQYFYFRNKGCVWPPEEEDDAPDFSAFDVIARKLGAQRNGQKSKLSRYLMSRLEETIFEGGDAPDFGHIEWSDQAPRWIRSDKGFIAFTKKSPDGRLLDALTDSLIHWGPAPSRLFLAKLRAELDRAGVAAEGKALGNNKVLAHWYKKLVEGSEVSRNTMVASTVARHTDMLMEDILPEVRDFATRMVTAEVRDDGLDALCLKYFKVDLSVRADRTAALNEHNAFVCSKPVEGHHLSTGHIFKLNDDYWVILTPACDLEPEQDRIKIGDYQPFMAAKLAKTAGNGPPAAINDGAAVVLKLEGAAPTGYTIAAQGNSQPDWRTFYAAKKGGVENNGFDLFLMTVDAATALPVMGRETVTLVGQLRYEYALSLMHRLGSSMTRVGLDFEKA